ncbi:hypothetical protein K491DRAFT_576534, partial [Lophiostoma macrostomum CBS 122681]
PGEGKHWIIPKRPEPLAANATVSYAVIGSTALAGGYASYARAHAQRAGFGTAISTPALFVRASAKAGIWCALGGAAINWYYHYGFTGPVSIASNITDLEWKIWEKTERYTIDDGFLVGAGLGLASSLFLRRLHIPSWTRYVGMTNIGGCAGILAANAYFQYTGERARSNLALAQWRQRRNLEFHWVYWNKLLMASLSKPVQAYVMYQGMFHAAQLPEEALTDPGKYRLGHISDTSLPLDKKTDGKEESKAHYYPPDDPAKILRDVTAESLKAALDSKATQRAAILIDANYIMRIISQKEYAFCHLDNASADERHELLREIQMYQVIFSRLKDEANKLERQLLVGSQRLRQKHSLAGEDTLPSWEMPADQYDPKTHEPKLALPEIEQYTEKFLKDMKDIEKGLATQGISDEDKARLKKDLSDARELLKASDKIIWDLEKRIKKVDA